MKNSTYIVDPEAGTVHEKTVDGQLVPVEVDEAREALDNVRKSPLIQKAIADRKKREAEKAAGRKAAGGEE